MSLRSPRNILLAAASAVGVIAAGLELASSSLMLDDITSFPSDFTAIKVAAGFDVLAWALVLAAFGAALAAFLMPSRSTRTKVLAVAAGLFVGHGLSELASNLIRAIETASPQLWQFTATEYAAAAAGASLAVAALLVALGVLSARPDGRLGWASIALAGNFALLAVAYSFELAGVLAFETPPGEISGGIGTTAAGQLVVAGAAVVAGLAFFTADGRRRRGEPWQALREGSLGLAAIVFAVGFLLVSVGSMLVATQFSREGHFGTEQWLQAVSQLMLGVAAICGAVGFFVSRRGAERRALEHRNGPDPAALPDPG